MNYERHEDRSITASVQPEGVDVSFRASTLHLTSTGPHALIEISVGMGRPTVDSINLHKNAQRVSLSNNVWKSLGERGQEAVPQKILKSYLDDFCRDLWTFSLGEIRAVQAVGRKREGGDRYLLYPYLMPQSITALFGPPVRGKSWTSLAMAITANSGLSNLFGEATRPVKALYLNLERGEESMYDRLYYMNKALGLPETTPLGMINERGRSLVDVEQAVRDAIREDGYEILIFDGLSRAGLGSMVDDAVMNKAMDILNSFNVCVNMVAHTPRGDESHIFGSQMSTAAVDMELSWIAEKNDDGTILGGLKCISANDVREPETRNFAYEFDEHGLSRVRKASTDEFSEKGSEFKTIRTQVKEYLLSGGQATATEVAEELVIDRKLVSNALQHSEFVRLPKVGKRQPYAVKTNDVHPMHMEGAQDITNVHTGGRVRSTPRDVRMSQNVEKTNEPTQPVIEEIDTSDFKDCSGCQRFLMPSKYVGAKGLPLCENCADDEATG